MDVNVSGQLIVTSILTPTEMNWSATTQMTMTNHYALMMLAVVDVRIVIDVMIVFAKHVSTLMKE